MGSRTIRFTMSLSTLLWSFASLPLVSPYHHQLPLEKPIYGLLDCPKKSKSTLGWKWTDVTPDRDLVWHDCFRDFQCARLDVPLDWLDPSDDERAVLAIIKLPATDLENYKGPVITNPGGPGGSGVYALKRSGHALQKIVGSDHDIISFDPRGIGASTPNINCWPSRQTEKIWNLQDVGVVDSHPGVVYDAYGRAAASSNLCTTSYGGNETSGIYRTLSYLSTTSVARDMLEILNKTGHEKLRYWGFSYGTMLGGMFAAMFPDKVERMVNDGNVDYAEWATCAHTNFLHDTDKIMEGFYHFCHLAGPTECAFYSPTPNDIRKRLERLLESLKINPVIIPPIQGSSDLPEIVNYSSLKKMISSALYRPIQLFPVLARACAALETGNGAPFLEWATDYGVRKQFSCNCEPCGIPPDSTAESESSDDAFRAIMCSDGGEVIDNPEEFAKYAEHLGNQSKAAGAVNVLFRISCVGWRAKAKWRFSGPFVGNTSHPILFIANKADNVTPLRSAQMNSKGFKDSVVLIQNSYGHTSHAAPSVCTASHIRAYFQNGRLPEQNTECDADIEPFQAVKRVSSTNVDQEELSAAVWELATTMPWTSFTRAH